MKQYGILAFPAKHSLSPTMFNAAFKEVGVEAQYGVFEIPENGLEDFIELVKHEPLSGLSVSLPYKEAVMKYLNQIDDDAKRIGAVNTILNKGGFLYGFNTDFIGSNKALLEEVEDLRHKKVVVIGGGGACRAVVYGLLKENADVSIFNRTGDKAKQIADEFEGIFDKSITAGSLKEMHFIEKGDILIQASSIWTLNPDINEDEVEDFIPSEFIDRFDLVMDIVYKPLMTPLLKTAKEINKKVITGEKMLLYQAVEQFKIWTEKEAPVEVMRSVLENALA